MSDICPKCGSKEVEVLSPSTKFSCDSTIYDMRPHTFKQSVTCHDSCKEGDIKYIVAYVRKYPRKVKYWLSDIFDEKYLPFETLKEANDKYRELVADEKTYSANVCKIITSTDYL